MEIFPTNIQDAINWCAEADKAMFDSARIYNYILTIETLDYATTEGKNRLYVTREDDLCADIADSVTTAREYADDCKVEYKRRQNWIDYLIRKGD